ncbi:hypothetical protein OGAPHI_002883 [Ogataea philodendri]|uniref:Phosphoglycerate mutase n=1 Tax=Ogataea philodendri TaxID=1378263 RepID=A0A9P8T6C3_9ASCO|nr:uncharacterized protein OGAPHI_002883 [Ogataea philodendri]KAH3667234.1 hypothetical protein OGAPHI_002883 [Ogataea philodendri]
MSDLIKVNECDVEDAYANADQKAIFRKMLTQEKLKRDPKTGKLLRPWNFEVVNGFFKQSDPSTDDSTFDLLEENFGLALDSWSSLKKKLKSLNDGKQPNESYKLIICARHGQGYHNRAVEIFGIEEWNRYWSHQTGTTLENGQVLEWGPDPLLTELGERQADELHQAWLSQIEDGAPIPTKFFTSPFTRSSMTLVRTWRDITIFENGDIKKPSFSSRAHPIVSENLRETIGSHLCDKRSSKKVISERFSKFGFEFESNFAEEDIYYRDDWRETLSEQSLRADMFLQDVFENHPDDIYISSTSHAGEIRAIITALGHREFAIPTAGTIPFVVKGTRVSNSPPS